MPKDTLDPGTRLGDAIPIDHFVIVMQENRSFDHYLQALPGAGQPHLEVAPPNYQNPDPVGVGEYVRPILTTDPCIADVPNNWVAVHDQIGNQWMRGFVAAANPDGKRALYHYDEKTLNYYYALANVFALADHYFAAVPGPTYPNRMFMHSATSFGHVTNSAPPPEAERRSIFDQLEETGKSWIIYHEGTTYEQTIYQRLYAEKGDHFRSIDEYHKDARAGKLPFYAWVESSHNKADATDEHAPANVQLGQAWVGSIVKSLMAGPNWSRSVLFLTYAEHGGFYDHVVPPGTCKPDNERPHIASRGPVEFDELGVRVPLIAISPYSRPHYVTSQVRSHTSLLRLIQARAGLPALTHRDANSEPPLEMFEFVRPAYPKPPTLPEPVIDLRALRRCQNEFGAGLKSATHGGLESSRELPSKKH